MTGLAPLFGAVALVMLAGLFSAIDAAISTVSIARVEAGPGRTPGRAAAGADGRRTSPLHQPGGAVADRVRTSATVLLAAYLTEQIGLNGGLFATAAIMVVTSFVVIGVGPRTLGGRTPTRSRWRQPFRCMPFRFC